MCGTEDDALGHDTISHELPQGDEQLARQRRATIIFLRRRAAFSVRARNHLAKALSFWKLRKRHASWIIPRRTRALPDRARPFSRRLLPLSSGEPVRPA